MNGSNTEMLFLYAGIPIQQKTSLCQLSGPSLLALFHKHTHLYHTVLLSYTHIVPTLSASSLPVWLSLWWVVGFRRRGYQPAWALCEHSHAYDSSMGQRTSACICLAVPALIRSSLGYVRLTHSARPLTLFCGKCWHGMGYCSVCLCVHERVCAHPSPLVNTHIYKILFSPLYDADNVFIFNPNTVQCLIIIFLNKCDH